MNKRKIDFNSLGSKVFSGRQRGEEVRIRLELDKYDSNNTVFEVVINDSTYAVTSSFFLGMFGPSIKHYKSREAFLRHYKFKCSSRFLDVIESSISRVFNGLD